MFTSLHLLSSEHFIGRTRTLLDIWMCYSGPFRNGGWDLLLRFNSHLTSACLPRPRSGPGPVNRDFGIWNYCFLGYLSLKTNSETSFRLGAGLWTAGYPSGVMATISTFCGGPKLSSAFL